MNYVTKLWNKANENVANSGFYGVSDMECYTKEELKALYLRLEWEWTEEFEVRYADGLYSIEWEGCYGRFTESFANVDEFNKALDTHTAEREVRVREEYNRLLAERKERMKAFKESRNTLGNLFPELSKLK